MDKQSSAARLVRESPRVSRVRRRWELYIRLCHAGHRDGNRQDVVGRL